MAESKDSQKKAGALRGKAEKIARKEARDIPGNLRSLSPAATAKLLHELKVHQMELEMLNEELRETQVKLEESQARYFELFDVAPVGYFSIKKTGIIQDVNLTGANLLGAVPRDLRGHLLSSFILKKDREIYYLHRKQLLETLKPQLCEMRMVRRDGSLFWARTESTLGQNGKSGKPLCHVTISDITLQKQVEHSLKQRYKEQKCLYSILSLFESPDAKLDELLKEIVMLIPQGWQFPEITEARIVLEGQAFQTARFRETPWMQASKIIVSGKTSGQVEVCYIERPQESPEVPLLKEEGQLLDAISSRLGQITLRKREEERIRASEDRYRNLVENTAEGVCVLQDGLVKFANRALIGIVGSSAEEMSDKLFLDYVHPDDRALVIEREIRRLNGEKLEASYDFRARDKYGKTRWLEVNVALITWEGKPATLTFLKDITAHKMAKEALRESEERYRLLADNTVDGIWLLNMDLKLIYCSPAAEKQSGFTVPEIMEMPLEQYFTPQSFQAVTELLLLEMPRVVADPDYEGNPSLDLEFMKKDGTAFWAECKFRIIRDEHRKPLSVLAMARDISERKQSEAKLLDSYRALQRTLNDAINTMAGIVEMRDPYTAGHQRRVAELATAIAGKMKWEEARIDQLRMAALIHDIGKINVPSDILAKPGKLEELEFELIKTHAQSGYDIVKGMDLAGSMAKAILQHHERLDGSGYPNHLKGEDTLLEAKIIAVADVVEAMASQRPYRPALGIKKALEEIADNRGRLYDPDVVDASLEVFESGEFEFTSA